MVNQKNLKDLRGFIQKAAGDTVLVAEMPGGQELEVVGYHTIHRTSGDTLVFEIAKIEPVSESEE